MKNEATTSAKKPQPQSWIEQSILDSLDEIRRLALQGEQRSARLEAMEKESKSDLDLSHRMDKVETQLQSLQKENRTFRAWAEKVATKMGQLDPQIQQIEPRISKMETTVDNIAKTVESAVNELRKQLIEFRKWFDS